jgi:ribose transport system substrate-binding protein
MICGLLMTCSEKKNSEKKLLISVIPKGSTHIFWQSIHAGAVRAGLEMNVDISWIGPEKEDDRQQQIALIDNQVMNQVSGIVLAPIDDMALRRPVRSAVERGVPVVIIDSGLKDSEDVYTSYIATDNKEGGRIAGRRLAALLDGRGKVIVLRESEGAASTQARADGFVEAVSEHPDIKVVLNDQYVGVTKTLAQQAAENILLRFTDSNGALTIDGIFCPNESTTYGMLQALRRRRLAGKIKFIGFDSSESVIEGISLGEIQGIIVQNPFKMGYLGVITMVNHLRSKPVQKLIDTGATFVNKSNLNDPAVKELLYPDLKKWLGQ